MTHNLTLIQQALKQQLAATDKKQIVILKEINKEQSKILVYSRQTEKFELYKNTEFLDDYSDLETAVRAFERLDITKRKRRNKL